MTPEEQEARTVKYCAPTVAALSSGRFAVFGPYSIASGIPFLQICDAADLHSVVQRETLANTAAFAAPIYNLQTRKSAPPSVEDVFAKL